jgi:hypothetical protein
MTGKEKCGAFLAQMLRQALGWPETAKLGRDEFVEMLKCALLELTSDDQEEA